MKNLTGIILAGGKSSRFKSPKYLAKINDLTLLEIAISKLKPFCSEIIVVGKEPVERREDETCLPAGRGERRDGRGLSRGDCPAVNYTGTVPAQKKDCPHKIKYVIEKDKRFHPLIGIIEGLKSSKTSANLILAADMPFISKELIKDLISSPLGGEGKGGEGQGGGDSEARLYCYKGRAEPLLGFYHKSCLPKITSFLHSRLPTPDSRLNARIIDALAECKIEYIEIADERIDFFNINTKEDLIEAQKIVQNNPNLLS